MTNCANCDAEVDDDDVQECTECGTEDLCLTCIHEHMDFAGRFCNGPTGELADATVSED